MLAVKISAHAPCYIKKKHNQYMFGWNRMRERKSPLTRPGDISVMVFRPACYHFAMLYNDRHWMLQEKLWYIRKSIPLKNVKFKSTHQKKKRRKGRKRVYPRCSTSYTQNFEQQPKDWEDSVRISPSKPQSLHMHLRHSNWYQKLSIDDRYSLDLA